HPSERANASMAFVHVCGPRAAGQHSRAGANAAANACCQRALTDITRATRELDFLDCAEMSAFSESDTSGLPDSGRFAKRMHVSRMLTQKFSVDSQLLNPKRRQTASQ